jgi:hypothetical protein
MAQLNECFVGGSNLVSLPERYDDRNESVQRDGTHVTCDSLFWSRATGRVFLLPSITVACGN